jgi:putative tryptophan/tyrosine transport system substrate-binding protein
MKIRLLRLAIVAALLMAPTAAHTQATPKIVRIGWLSPGSASAGASNFDALRSGLGELGYVEGRNLVFEKRWADGVGARLPALAAELVRLKVDVICVAGTPAALAAKGATATVPIVFANVAFPDQSHLVDSYARPGSNVTGVAFIGPEYGKRLELLKEALPKLRRVGLIYNPENRASVLAVEETRRWATTLEIALDAHTLRGPEELDPMFDAIGRSHPEAIMTTADVLIHSYRTRIVQYATKNRLASMFPDKEYVLAGGLMFYGGSIPDMYRRAGIYVDRILKGAKTAELPVEQPTKFDMIVNLKTARALGVTIPPSILLRADQVID